MTEQLAAIEPTNARERELRDRAVRDYAAFLQVGLETGATFFAPGTEVGKGWAADYAKGKIARARRDAEKLPIGPEALTLLSDTVVAEDRQDLVCQFGGKEPDYEAKRLLTAFKGWEVDGPTSNQLFAPTERAYQALMAKRPAEHAAPGPDIGAWYGDIEAHNVVIRHRLLPEHRKDAYNPAYRECYAVVSEKYQAYDLDAAANDLRDVIPHDSRARIRYDGQRATVDIVLQNPYRLDGADGAAVGEAHKVVLRMRTADDGSAGYHISLLAERVRCVNLTLLHAKKALFSGTHRQSDLRGLAQEALASVEPIMAQFAERWRSGWSEYYADKYTGRVTGEEALKRIVSWGKFRIPGLGKEGTLDAVLAALATEPGDSKLHVHNAMTLAAHAAPVSWQTRWADDAAEEQASALLYQKVLHLPEVPDEVTYS